MEFYIRILVTVAVAAIGWVVAHWFTSKRELRNEQRRVKLESLREAHNALVRAGIDGTLVERDEDGNITSSAKDVENALATVNLFGSERQVSLANAYIESMDNSNSADGTKLVDDLREDMRAMLGLEPLSDTPHYLRVTVRDLRKSGQNDGKT